jgi:hypothetical protein
VQSTYIAIYSFTSTYIAIYSFIYVHYNLFDQKKVFSKLTSVCRWRRLPCTRGRVAVAEEEEADSSASMAVEETGMSGVDGGGGDRQSRERRSRESGGT